MSKLPARVGDYVVRECSYITLENSRHTWFEVNALFDKGHVLFGKYRTLNAACDAAIAASSPLSQRAYPATDVEGYKP